MKKLTLTICDFVIEHNLWLGGGWSLFLFLFMRLNEVDPMTFDEVFVLAFGMAVLGYFSFIIVILLPCFLLWHFLGQGLDDD